MADHTPVSVPSSSHKCELNVVSTTNSTMVQESQPTYSETDRGQCNGTIHDTCDRNIDLDMEFSANRKENQNVSNCTEVHVSSSTYSSLGHLGGKTGCLEKVNGLTHADYSSRENGLLVNLINSCCKEDAECNSGDSGRGSGSVCQCPETDCDDVSCDEVRQEKKLSTKVHCDSTDTGHNEVDILLSELEKASIKQLNNPDESCLTSAGVIDGVTYVVYESEKQMPDIMRLITKDLSEPYSIYTYRYFIHNWPKLCFLAMADEKCVGAIVCKLDLHKKMVRRGYIAMLAVDSEYRRRRIGSTLVTKAIEAMIRDDCDEVVLETEITNQGALHLYENLGFVRDKRLFRYYLNGVDALRLKLWLR